MRICFVKAMIFNDDYRTRGPLTQSWTDWLERLHIDFGLLLVLMSTAALGMVILYSASGVNSVFVIQQGLRMGLSLAVLLLFAQIPSMNLRRWAPWLYGLTVILLMVVAALGDIGKGAQRWLDLGVIRFQPSELMKLAMPMVIAAYIHDRGMPPRPRDVGIVLGLIAIPVGLVAEQPDLGTALLIAAAGIWVLFLSGLSWIWIGTMFTAIGTLMPIFWYFLHDYQRQRVLTFLNPEQDPLGTGYHIIQSKIALGSGGIFGKGWLNGSQSHLQFLPERTTDFIFAVYGEEFGLLGLLVLLLLYSLLIGRGLMISLRAQDSFERLLAGSLSLTFFVYVFVNTGMVTGLLPVVGVPLPLISYGGTSMVTLAAGFGILMSIHTHKKLVAQ
jgi:rod shape determining protein RodA